VTAGLGSGRRARALWEHFSSPRARNESGFTLIEIMITVWIMGALMVCFIGALFTMTKASDVARSRAEGEAELRHLEDTITAAPYDTTCPQTLGASSYLTAYNAIKPTEVTVDASQPITYWDGTPVTDSGGHSTDVPDMSSGHIKTTSPCSTNFANRIQVFTLSITVNGATPIVVQQPNFVKRDNGTS
jgi:prepilin-type N-terminal cleavage/methylation domain-containing protein